MIWPRHLSGGSGLGGLVLAGWLTIVPVFGHGDVHGQIEQVTQQLEQHPTDVDLVLKRARLHQVHEAWDMSAADFDRAELLAPTLAAVHLGRGQMLLAAGRLDPAQSELDLFTARKPELPEGWIIRARIEAKRSHPREAAADFQRALDLSPRPDPEHYLECAQALAAMDPPRRAEAVAILDRGLAKLGNLPSLGLPAVDYEVQLKRHDAALERLQRLGASSPRPEIWLERRGDVFRQAERRPEAVQCYRAALAKLIHQSSMVQARPATREMQARIEQKLAAMTSGDLTREDRQSPQ